MSPEQIAKIYAYAKRTYADRSDDDIELDDLSMYQDPTFLPTSRLSVGEAGQGTFILAWLWVPASAYEEDAT